MTNIRRIFLPLLGLILIFGCNQTEHRTPMSAKLRPTPPPLHPVMEEFLKDYNAFFQDSMILSGTPGAAVVVVKDSQVVYMRGFGVRAEGNPSPIDENTVFRIGSLSKGFAGILAGMLENEGKFAWYDKVQQYVPDFSLSDPAQAERLEVRHILTQTTGLPYHSFSNLIEQGFTTEYILSQFPLARLAGKEGNYFSYQNAAYCLIEPVLQNVTGKTYRELLSERLFKPLGMNAASCDYEAIANSPNHALPHRYRAGIWVADSITHRYYNYPAAGGVNASITDMAEWLKALLGHKQSVVPVEVLKDVFTPVIATGLERPVLRGFIDRDSAYYGKGWRILEHGPDTLVYHAGFVNNYHSEIALNYRDGIGICVLFNAPSPLAGRCISGFFKRWEVARRKLNAIPHS